MAAAVHVYLAKFNANGAVVYTKTYDAGFGALHVDDAGNVYLTGGLARTTFPTTSNAYLTTGGGAFVVKLGPDGSTLFSTFLAARAFPTAISTDSAGNVLVCGWTSSGFPTTSGAYEATSSADTGFCSKLSGDGRQLLASTLFGPGTVTIGTSLRPVTPSAVAADTNGNFVVAGSVYASDFPASADAFQKTDLRRSLFRQSAGSANWNAVEDTRLNTVTSIEFDRQNPQRIFVSTDTGIFRSDDRGQTWAQVNNTPTLVLKVHPLNASYQARVNYSFGIEGSKDGGVTWTRINVSRPQLYTSDELLAPYEIAPDFSDEGSFFANANVNAGTIRFSVKTGAIPQRMPILGTTVAQTNPAVLFVGIPLYRSRDAGASFQQLQFVGVRVWPAPSDPNAVYAYGYPLPAASSGQSYYRSDDGGDTWRQLPGVPVQRNTTLFVDPDSADVVYAFGLDGGIQRSIDGGQTWNAFDDGLLAGVPRVMAKDASGQLWTGTNKIENGFIARISGDAKQLLYSSLLGGAGGGAIRGMSFDEQGR